jgi:hypothetical protein
LFDHCTAILDVAIFFKARLDILIVCKKADCSSQLLAVYETNHAVEKIKENVHECLGWNPTWGQ